METRDMRLKTQISYTYEGVINKMKERYQFTVEKYEDNRGLSTSKGILQLATLSWLLGEKDAFKHIEKFSYGKFLKLIKSTYLCETQKG